MTPSSANNWYVRAGVRKPHSASVGSSAQSTSGFGQPSRYVRCGALRGTPAACSLA